MVPKIIARTEEQFRKANEVLAGLPDKIVEQIETIDMTGLVGADCRFKPLSKKAYPDYSALYLPKTFLKVKELDGYYIFYCEGIIFRLEINSAVEIYWEILQ